MRFHGRNAVMWYKGDNTTRYDYNYMDFELKAFVDPLKALVDEARLQIYFNNHNKGRAPKNAKQLEELLKDVIRR